MADNKMNQGKKQAAEETIRSIMYQEAIERMKLLGVSEKSVDSFLEDKAITKCVVDHLNMRVGKQILNDEEKELINQVEQERDYLVYYLIEDEGLWPDGCSFPRYTVLYVNKYREEYEQVKKCIQRYDIIPAYVINREEPRCSELTEIGFRNVSGLIINAT